MTKTKWEQKGAQLVDDFLNSGQSVPKSLMDDLDEVLSFTGRLPF